MNKVYVVEIADKFTSSISVYSSMEKAKRTWEQIKKAFNAFDIVEDNEERFYAECMSGNIPTTFDIFCSIVDKDE